MAINLLIQEVGAFESFPNVVERTIFLAGPTPRSDEVQSWRPEAVRMLGELGFSGHVFVPEASDPQLWLDGFEAQEEWENTGLHRADVLVFWVPRDFRPIKRGRHRGKPRMGALTTNMEFGEQMKRGGVVVGAPPSAPQMGAFVKKGERYGIPFFSTLRETLVAAVNMIGDGARREGPWVGVPLHVWRWEVFQWWRGQIAERGEQLVSIRVLKTYPEGNWPLEYLVLETRTLIGDDDEPTCRVFML